MYHFTMRNLRGTQRNLHQPFIFIVSGQEMVGNYNANFYSINGMVLETRKRREHLTKEDLQKNKALLENFATGNTQYLEEQNGV